MQEVTYYVVFHRGEWQIECNGHHYGPHKSQDVATKLAVAAAKLAKRDGDFARVIIQKKDNSWHTEWQNGFENNSYVGALAY